MRTHCKTGRHEWVPENIFLDHGRERCRLCKNERLQRSYQAQKARRKQADLASIPDIAKVQAEVTKLQQTRDYWKTQLDLLDRQNATLERKLNRLRDRRIRVAGYLKEAAKQFDAANAVLIRRAIGEVAPIGPITEPTLPSTPGDPDDVPF